MLSRAGTIAAFVALAAAAAPAAALADARGAGFSSETLTRTIQAQLREAAIPGAIVGVWRGDRQLYRRALGVRDIATGRPMATNFRTRIGSVTKSFVVTAVLQLVDQGKVGLDDPIAKYVRGVPNGNRITIRQLAGMRSGLYSYTNTIIPRAIARQPQRQWTVPELLRISFRRAPLFAPGRAFDYSNTNTLLLGLVVENVSGQSLSAYLEQSILRPERLTRTLFPRGAEFPSPHAEGYTNWTPTGFGDPLERGLNATDWNPAWGGAAGAMISTLDDLRRWAPALATGRLLRPATQRERVRFRTAPGEGGATYGLGLMNYGGWVGHDGNIAGYITFPFYLPAERTTLVVMLNANSNPLGAVNLMRAITRIITPRHLWPDPRQAD
jgi:D-alanyl-D-alanine carboxypeptidase